MKKRFALILGGPHAGTTRLFRRLGRHPGVLSCRVAEPRFFSDDRKWALGLDWYRSLWEFREPDERVAIEATAAYGHLPLAAGAAARAARTPAGFRFIWLLREPGARIAAWYAARVADGLCAPVVDAEELARERRACRYARSLAAWREHFPEEDFLLLASEDWDATPSAVLGRICRFLEIVPAPPPARGSGVGPGAGRAAAPGRMARWLGARGRRARAAARPAPARLPDPVERELAREWAEERTRLAEEWSFAPLRWRRAGGS